MARTLTTTTDDIIEGTASTQILIIINRSSGNIWRIFHPMWHLLNSPREEIKIRWRGCWARFNGIRLRFQICYIDRHTYSKISIRYSRTRTRACACARLPVCLCLCLWLWLCLCCQQSKTPNDSPTRTSTQLNSTELNSAATATTTIFMPQANMWFSLFLSSQRSWKANTTKMPTKNGLFIFENYNF